MIPEHPENQPLPSSLWVRYRGWSRERFPVPAVLVYSAALFYLVYGFAGMLPGARAASAMDSVAGWLLLFLILFRLRVTDEEKDFPQDVQAYPERMLSRGVITLRLLYVLFFVSLLLETMIALSLGRRLFGLWLLINGWFFLMYVEFFVPRFLNAHIGWYLITHQLLMPLFALLPLAMRVDVSLLSRGALQDTVALFTALICGTMTYEIARKTWPPEREHPDAVSYSGDWGIPVSVFINQIFAWTCSGLLGYVLYARTGRLWPVWVMAPVNAGFLMVDVRFALRPEPARARALTAMGTAVMFVAFFSAIAAFAFSGAFS